MEMKILTDFSTGKAVTSRGWSVPKNPNAKYKNIMNKLLREKCHCDDKDIALGDTDYPCYRGDDD